MTIAARVINLLTNDPDRSFTNAEIADRAGAPLASVRRVTFTLCNAFKIDCSGGGYGSVPLSYCAPGPIEHGPSL